MGTHLQLKSKVSKILSSFKSCRSKHPSSLPFNPLPSSFLPLKPHRFSLHRHVSCRPHSSPTPSLTQSSLLKWRKQPKWHVIAFIPQNYHFTPPRPKIYTSPTSADKQRRVPRRRRRMSSSSDSGVVSTDSSVVRRRRRRRLGRRSDESPSPARLSEFMRKMMPCTAEEVVVVEGKVRDSFAVVKRSEDPYVDFRRSMAEMVVEKRIFERNDMEELLRCFLSLNSEHLHGVIVRAFVDIWDALFCRSSSSR
ncbi:hypothetical protein RND81_11G199300 [Saponaria officinalis]|uniref:Transcription repressor n=1 Tax=Saponaria officinalis TaxID=3572 RepID=A0AAW1HPA8_SAPOF